MFLVFSTTLNVFPVFCLPPGIPVVAVCQFGLCPWHLLYSSGDPPHTSLPRPSNVGHCARIPAVPTFHHCHPILFSSGNTSAAIVQTGALLALPSLHHAEPTQSMPNLPVPCHMQGLVPCASVPCRNALDSCCAPCCTPAVPPLSCLLLCASCYAPAPVRPCTCAPPVSVSIDFPGAAPACPAHPPACLLQHSFVTCCTAVSCLP